MNNRELGGLGESMAREHLEEKGYRIVDCNYSARFAEIDLIAIDGQFLVFVEVKTRKNSRYGQPIEAVDYRKISKIRKLAEIYIEKNKLYKYQPRFDIIGIVIDFDEKRIDHIKNAF